MHLWIRINQVNVFRCHSSKSICHCICLSVSKASCERVYILWKYLLNAFHYIGLYISCFFEDFFFHCVKKLLWLHQNWTLYAHVLAYILFRKGIHRQRSHRHPHNLISIFCNPFYKLLVAIMQEILLLIIIIKSPYIVFGEGAINITDHKLIIFCIKINFSWELHLR